MNRMKLKTNDKVFVLTGKDKGKTGKIIQVFPKLEKVVVEGVNILKKHARANKSGQKGQVIELAAPLHISKVMFYCVRCEKPVRLGARMVADKKERICKKCKEVV